MSSTKNNRLNAEQAAGAESAADYQQAVIELAGKANDSKTLRRAGELLACACGQSMKGVHLNHKERILFMVERISEEEDPDILRRIDHFVTLWYAKAKF